MKYKITLFYKKETHTFHTYAQSKNRARYNAFIQLAKKLHLTSAYPISCHFHAFPNDCTITLVTEKEQQKEKNP
jgi:hypothetical protein